MSFLLTFYPVAYTLSRLLRSQMKPVIPESLQFLHSKANIEFFQIPTRHGNLQATVYRPTGVNSGDLNDVG